MFQGGSALTLDAKGRITIPTRHRDALIEQAGGSLTLTRHPDGCLLMYPRPVWEEKCEQLIKLPGSGRGLQRLLIGHAQNVEIDGAGRVLVSPELRSDAGLTRDVMLLGLGKFFELWDAATLAEREKTDMDQDMAAVLDQFSF